MTNHRGNVSLKHNTIQSMLKDILEERKPHTKKPKIEKEWTVDSKMDYNSSWVIDVADLTDPGHPVYYEVESDPSKTESTRQKQLALAKHNRIDLVIIPVWELDWDNCSMAEIEAWLRERVI